MYNSLKKVIRNLIPNKVLYMIEPGLRSFFALSKKGKQHECTICHFKNKEWIILENEDKLCPKCGSLSRDRRLWEIIASEYLPQVHSVLDFSPSRCLYRKWKNIQNKDYYASDLSGDFISDHHYDITEIATSDASFDLILCYHILEHIPDDVQAMKELFRVLKTNGKILIQTPFKDGEIYEDKNITSEQDRLIHFGQEDHVRIYSVEGLKKRLESVGFSIEVKSFDKNDYFGFRKNEIILVATK